MIKKPKKIKNLKTNELLLVCDCRSEVLRIEYDPEIQFLELAIYTNNINMSLWQRLRYIWQVLYHGKPYNDQIMINKQEIKKLACFLNSV
jgi:hypothetical protein